MVSSIVSAGTLIGTNIPLGQAQQIQAPLDAAPMNVSDLSGVDTGYAIQAWGAVATGIGAALTNIYTGACQISDIYDEYLKWLASEEDAAQKNLELTRELKQQVTEMQNQFGGNSALLRENAELRRQLAERDERIKQLLKRLRKNKRSNTEAVIEIEERIVDHENALDVLSEIIVDVEPLRGIIPILDQSITDASKTQKSLELISNSVKRSKENLNLEALEEKANVNI
ncbi:hypothetical protein [Streptacidiphilus rugosus]|uniref:hypothetical protein n=1 Tax=Streptacidiphilus rugosus TaxID=405783 RepID=UPI0012F93BF7|nr:hypothetical protein [Streptacidiphilus rugosus]